MAGRHISYCISYERGFTLVELLLAIVLLAILTIGGLNFFVYGRSDINREGHRRVALELASQKFEELKADGYALVISEDESNLSLDNISCLRTTSVTEIEIGELKEVTVTVSWDEKGVTNNVELTTLIAKR
jgi:prepilin-type N-terminal cleavage/methylation domain-containing protein